MKELAVILILIFVAFAYFIRSMILTRIEFYADPVGKPCKVKLFKNNKYHWVKGTVEKQYGDSKLYKFNCEVDDIGPIHISFFKPIYL